MFSFKIVLSRLVSYEALVVLKHPISFKTAFIDARKIET